MSSKKQSIYVNIQKGWREDMKKRLIFGCTPYSKLVRYTMSTVSGIETDGYCLSASYLNLEEFDERPVVPFEKLNELYGANQFEVLITVGYRGMNVGRESIFRQCEQNGYQIASYIHPEAKIETQAIGKGNIIMDGTHMYPFSQIGDGNILNGIILGHESSMGNFNFSSRCTTGGLAHIGNNCFLGINACICDNVNIGDYNLIGAGTVVSKSTKPNMAVVAPKPRLFQSSPDIIGSLFN